MAPLDYRRMHSRKIQSSSTSTIQEEGQQSSTSVLRRLCKDYSNNPLLLIEAILCALCCFGAPLLLFLTKTYERTIPYQETVNGDILLDLYFNRPLVEKQSVRSALLMILSFILPLSLIVATVHICDSSVLQKSADIHSGICAFLFSFGNSLILTILGKEYCGYFRPNFYQYCKFDTNSLSCDENAGKFGGLINDAQTSFPSGHASVSFSGLTMLTLFLLGKIGWNREVFAVSPDTTNLAVSGDQEESLQEDNTCNPTGLDDNRHMMKIFLKKKLLSCLACIPMLIALFIGLSRVRDDYHHPADIVAGALIGIACAIFAYGLWYPPLSSPVADLPLMLIYKLFADR